MSQIWPVNITRREPPLPAPQPGAWAADLRACCFVLRRQPDAPPFGAQLSDILQHLRETDSGCRAVARVIACCFRDCGETALLRALDGIAAAADRSGAANAYHNPDHSRAVAVSWLNLALIHNDLAAQGRAAALGAHAFLLGCCAAFGHDLCHDGTSNEAVTAKGARMVVPFRLESIAAAAVLEQFASAGVAGLDADAVRCAILCTDVVHGYPHLEAALAGVDQPAPFSALRDRTCVAIAALLRDADLLQSAGLRPADHDRSTRAVLAERGLAAALSLHQTAEILFGKVLKGRFVSQAGQVFQPNLDRLRALNALRLQSPGHAAADLADLAKSARA